MISIFHLLPSFELGGTETQLWKVASLLPRDEVEQKVFAFGDGPLRRRFSDNGIETRALGAGPVGVGRLFLELWTRRPQLLHTHLYPCNQVGRILGRLVPGCRVLGSDRCVDVYDGPFARFLERRTFRLGAGTLVNSQSVKTFLVLARGLPPERIAVVENGVEDPPAVRASREPRSETLRLLCVGRLAPQKGVQFLLRALAGGPIRSESWRLAVVGGGREEQALRSLAESLGISERVSWLGEKEDWTAEALDSDLFVLPSLFEGLPNVVIEAMARELPVIATDVGGTADLIEPGGTGWLVPPGDVEELRRALMEAKDADLREMGGNGRNRALRLFDLKRTAARTLQIYRSVLQGDGALQGVGGTVQ